jgi:hypothetical protein
MIPTVGKIVIVAVTAYTKKGGVRVNENNQPITAEERPRPELHDSTIRILVARSI